LSLTWSQISGDRFSSFPVVEEVVGSGLDGLVLRHDLHLEAGDLRLDRRILATNDLVESTPLALDKNGFFAIKLLSISIVFIGTTTTHKNLDRV